MHLPLMFLAALLCLLLPVGAAVWIHRRLGPRYALVGWGALTFVLSQVVHIPLNLGVAKLFSAGILPAPSPAVSAWLLPVALGLSAGLCEEPARWLAMRWLKDVRDWSRGLMLGVGHGGIEAVLVGVSIASSAVAFMVIESRGMDALGIPLEQQPVVQQQLDAVFQAPPWQMTLGAVERVFAMTCHLAMSLLVLQAHRTRNPAWLLASVGFHTVLNAGAVALAQRGMTVGAEVYVGGCALAAVAIILALRRTQQAEPAPEEPAVEPVDIARVQVERSVRQGGQQ